MAANVSAALDQNSRKAGRISWLSVDDDKANRFHADLNDLILHAPIISISCVIDRPGYVARYAQQYPKPWLLCQTAFAILVERACKYASEQRAKLEIYFEQSGRKEDRGILSYMKALKATGMPFPGSAAAGYENMSPEEFRAIVEGEPNRVTKNVPMVQFADLVLYAMARGGYEESDAPFRALHDHGRIIDAVLPREEIPARGVKYSCFDTKKARV